MISEIDAKHPWDYLGEEGRPISHVLADVDPEDECEVHLEWSVVGSRSRPGLPDKIGPAMRNLASLNLHPA